MLFPVILFLIITEHTGRYSFAKEVWIDPHDNVANDAKDHQSWSWHDPHDLGIDESSLFPGTESDTSTDKDSCARRQSNYSNVYLKRLINLILNSAKIEKELNIPYYSGELSINIGEEDYIFLKNYVDNYHEECIISLQKIDTIFANSLAKSTYEQYADFISSLGERLYNFIFNKFTTSCSLILFIAIFTYKLAQTNFSLWFIIKGLTLMAYIIDFATTYFHLIEAEEIKNFVDMKKGSSVPPECDPSKMTWTKYISYLFKSESDCLQYYKAAHRNLYYLVTPLKVMSHQFGVIVVGPITSLGTALGAFTHNIMNELPWGLNVILLPLLLLFACMILMILSAALLKRSIKFKMFPFIGFEFGNENDKRNQGDTLSGSNLENVLYYNRKFIKGVSRKTILTKKEETSDAKPITLKIGSKSKRGHNKKKILPLGGDKIMSANQSASNNNIPSASYLHINESKEP